MPGEVFSYRHLSSVYDRIFVIFQPWGAERTGLEAIQKCDQISSIFDRKMILNKYDTITTHATYLLYRPALTGDEGDV
jgi:hypothetical protein